jgi:hypothetical protein
MDFELAKKLKDTGFMQGGNGSWIGPSESLVWRIGDRVYVPALEELIEACGDSISHIVSGGKDGRLGYAGGNASARLKWAAFAFDESVLGTGATCHEAVARLWLALQNK